MKRLIFPAMALVVMAGCVPPRSTAPAYYNWLAPNNPEARVKEWMAANLKDPDSVKAYQWLGVEQGRDGKWFAKASWNAKNSYGAYTGLDTHFFCFQGDRITSEFTQSWIDKLNNGG